MSIAKVIEVLAEGDSIEAAIQSAVTEAAETVRGIRHVYVEGVQSIVEDDEVVKYRVNAKLTFVVESERDGESRWSRTSRAGAFHPCVFVEGEGIYECERCAVYWF